MYKTFETCKKSGYYSCHLVPDYVIFVSEGDLFPTCENYGGFDTIWVAL